MTCCVGKGASKNRNLEVQIDELFETGNIANPIKEWPHVIRRIGNDALHINADKVIREDAFVILNITKKILDLIPYPFNLY